MLIAWSRVAAPVIGMLHLPPLPGSPRGTLGLAQILRGVLRDAGALARGGVHGLMMENFGDVPFYPGRVPAHTVAQMTALAATVRREFGLPLGINVLRNDGLSALAIAHAVGAQFVRVNVLSGARVADQGVLQGIAHDLLRYRRELGAEVKILADVNVKHSAPLGDYPFADEVEDLLHRALADGVVVSGSGTGKAVDLKELKTVKALADQSPVFLGSGVSAKNIASLKAHASGFIVGTSLKVNGKATNPVDESRVRALLAALQDA